MAKHPQTPEACVTAWINYCRNEYQLLSKTLKGYEDRAKITIKTMLDNERNPLPYNWTSEDIRFFVEHYLNKGLRVKTVIGYHHVMQALADHFGNSAPARTKIKWPDDPTTNRRWLSLEQAKKIMSWPMTTKQNTAISLMLTMGRRRCEVIRANLSDFFTGENDKFMNVDGKGHKKFRMPFAPNFEKSFFAYLDERRDTLMEAFNDNIRKVEAFEPLIIARHRKNTYGRYNEIRATGFDKAITHAVSRDCRIHFSNHDLRRTFGRELYYTAGVDIVTIKNYYNHSNIEETLYYIGADQKRMSEEIKKIPF
ncbi:MAG: site-specific integrase [Methanomassiliicoccaceae archaeon]|nr:site-specific integrase [Methanomassiliicoccaceae archaeon]